VVDAVVKTKEVTNVNASGRLEHEGTFRELEGSHIEQEIFHDDPSFTVTARKDDRRVAHLQRRRDDRRWEAAEASKMLESAERIAPRRSSSARPPVEMGSAILS
jgi:hypothetical protein